MTQQEAIHRSIEIENEIEELRSQFYIPVDKEYRKSIQDQIDKIMVNEPESLKRKQKIAELRKELKAKRIDAKSERELQKKIDILQKESDDLWEYAKSFRPDSVVHGNYERLANAIVKQAVLDYEALISGKKADSNLCNLTEIERFAKTTMLTKVDIPSMLKKIKRVREKEFVPFAAEHYNEIVNEYKKFKRKRVNTVIYNDVFPYRCKVCGGALKPDLDNKNKLLGIECCGCETYIYKGEIDRYNANKLMEEMKGF